MKFDHKTLFVMLSAMVLLSASHAQAITLGGSAFPGFENATAEYDPSIGKVTSWVVNGQEQLGIGGIGFYINVGGNTQEVAIFDGSVVPGFGTFELVRTTVEPLLADPTVIGSVESLFNLDGVLTARIGYDLGSNGIPGVSEAASLESKIRFNNISGDPLDITFFELYDYSLNGAPTPGGEPVTIDSTNARIVQTEDNTEATAAISASRNTSQQPGDLSPDGLDIDDVETLLASLNDNSTTSTSGVRNDSGDVAALFEFRSLLVDNTPNDIDDPPANSEATSSVVRRVLSVGSPEPTVIPEPTTALGTGLAFLGLCNYLTKRRTRTR